MDIESLISRYGMQGRELDVIRHVLTGGSVIDWRRLDLANRAEVDQHLALNKLDGDDPRDARYMRGVLAESVRFLEGILGRKIDEEVAGVDDVRDVFLLARRERPRRIRMDACFCLKVMNIVNHLNGRELLFRVPISERDLTFMAHAEVSRVVDKMRGEGFPIVDFEGGEKTRDSMILKLLAKKETLAAAVYDKIRFRVTVEHVDDIVGVILHFTRHLFPFNYVIPGQSQNEIVPLPEQMEEPSIPGALPRTGPAERHQRHLNEFSGQSYRHLDFVADLPLRLDQFVNVTSDPGLERLGSVVYAMVEFQVIDRLTARANEAGENNHEAYKQRQRERVVRRLERPHAPPDERARMPEGDLE